MSTEKSPSLSATLDERGEQYGDYAEMARTAQQLKVLLRNVHHLPVPKESVDMICTKLARIAHGNPNNVDSWKDIAGYAMLVVKELEK